MTTEFREVGFAGMAGGCDVDVEDGIVEEVAFEGVLAELVEGTAERAEYC